jgi:hypothetical protein
MGAIKTLALERVVTGIRNGGQIGLPIIEAAVERALDAVYEATEMIKAELTKISEVVDQQEYALTPPAVASSGRLCRIDRLYRISYDAGDTESSRTLIDPALYSVGISVDETAAIASISEVLALNWKPSKAATDSLLPIGVLAFTVDDFIPSMHSSDAHAAITAHAIAELSGNTGKPWADSRKALIEQQNFNAAISRIRYKTLRGNTGRGLAMKCTGSFV